jgi:hypothetical protein
MGNSSPCRQARTPHAGNDSTPRPNRRLELVVASACGEHGTVAPVLKQHAAVMPIPAVDLSGVLLLRLPPQKSSCHGGSREPRRGPEPGLRQKPRHASLTRRERPSVPRPDRDVHQVPATAKAEGHSGLSRRRRHHMAQDGRHSPLPLPLHAPSTSGIANAFANMRRGSRETSADYVTELHLRPRLRSKRSALVWTTNQQL